LLVPFLVEDGLVRNCNQATIHNVLYSIRNIFNYLDNICDMK